MQDKKQDIIKLAIKGGKDSELFLLDKLHTLEEEIDKKMDEMDKMHSEIKSEMKDMINNMPNLNNAFEMVKGKDGKDSEVPGPQGEIGPIGPQGESIVGPKGDRGERGEIGLSGIDGKDGKSIVGPAGLNGKDGSPDTPIQIVEKLETLEGEDRLDKSAVKGLDEELKSIKESKGGQIYGPGKTRIIVKDLSASLNGVTKTFALGGHFGIISVVGSSSPFAFRPTIDFVESGKNIVFDPAIDASTSLASGQTLIVQILK